LVRISSTTAVFSGFGMSLPDWFPATRNGTPRLARTSRHHGERRRLVRRATVLQAQYRCTTGGLGRIRL
jgi:hypothetical protein